MKTAARRRRRSSAAAAPRSHRAGAARKARPLPGEAPPPAEGRAPAPRPPARRRHERVGALRGDAAGGRHLPGCRDRRLSRHPRRLGRRPRQDLRQYHASRGGGTGGPRAGAAAGAGADAGGAALLRHPRLAAGGGRAQHGPAHQGGCRSAHLQHHGCHHQQDHRAGHGQGGRPRRLRQQEML
ncbi:hypothetical protein RLOC_00010007 [Lonchura striata]|uniref:Uncharacterized protein n=1 Tax=Lonchura striata TaxID=40157 RepID=A0A218U7L7_9PASE|nr:hypothetical protein RLOC_00010007 [Lonchura striata domestica]